MGRLLIHMCLVCEGLLGHTVTMEVSNRNDLRDRR